MTNPNDPLCFNCEGPVEVIERAETFVTVFCPACEECYGADIERKENGQIVYWPSFRVTLSGGPEP
jgi:hypothetical protein